MGHSNSLHFVNVYKCNTVLCFSHYSFTSSENWVGAGRERGRGIEKFYSVSTYSRLLLERVCFKVCKDILDDCTIPLWATVARYLYKTNPLICTRDYTFRYYLWNIFKQALKIYFKINSLHLQYTISAQSFISPHSEVMPVVTCLQWDVESEKLWYFFS